MRKLFSEYGLLILMACVVIILISIANPTSKLVKHNIQTTAHSFNRTEMVFERRLNMPVQANEIMKEEIKKTELILKDFLGNTNILAGIQNQTSFEIDSKCPNSVMVPQIEEQIKKEENSLLATGTWAYMGNPRKEEERYLFWTSVDVNKEGETIPVLISGYNNSFYVSTSVTVKRTNKSKIYYAIAKSNISQKEIKQYLTGTKYDNLMDAYKAYEELYNELY